MTSKMTNRFSFEVRARAVRMVLEHQGERSSRWAAVCSIAEKIGCTAQTLIDWVKKTEIDSGARAGLPTEVDPPPLKWSDLKYVLWHQGGSEHANKEAHA
jgi:transposase